MKVRVEGYNYTGMGNSIHKKDAQSNAARDFVNYLVRINELKSEEVPAIGVSMAKQLETYVYANPVCMEAQGDSFSVLFLNSILICSSEPWGDLFSQRTG